MRRLAAILSLAALSALSPSLSGCGDSQAAPSGLDEPLTIAKAQFIEGPFPAPHDGGPAISQISIRNTEFIAGTTGKAISGLAGAGAQSVAVGLQGLGHGFWILPIGAPALQEPGTFEWAATVDFSHQLTPGPLPLLIAASNASGQFGPTFTETLNVDSLVPTGHVVASLTWGSNADLDIHLLGPSGKELDPKHPNTGALDSDGMAKAHNGLLDRDSMASCTPDGLRTENVVWSDSPEKGGYLVRVDMFSACSKPAATFAFSLYVDGQVVLKKTGRLLDIDADGGGPGSGLFVTEFSCLGDGTCAGVP
ncbi:MAG: hypothetical protein ABI548_04235 [Polyangiaceae bacterium]